MKAHLLLTAAPGTGKTTVIRRVAESLAGETLAGFCTEEMRTHGERRGFLHDKKGSSRRRGHRTFRARYTR